MMFRKAAAIFSIFISISIYGLWAFLLISGNVPEVVTEPIRIAVHIFSEYLTASLLLAGGIGLLRGRKWASSLFLVSMGMLMYSVLTGVGLYTQHGEYAMTAMFALFFLLAVLFALKVREGR